MEDSDKEEEEGEVLVAEGSLDDLESEHLPENENGWERVESASTVSANSAVAGKKNLAALWI